MADQNMELEIHDTGGAPEYESHRKIIYEGADLFLLCVSADRNDYWNGDPNLNSAVNSDLVDASI